MTHGDPAAAAAALTGLIAPFGFVSPTDRWMPEGFDVLDEAELHKSRRLLAEKHCEIIRDWWFAKYIGGLQTGPSFDIASTCTVTVGNDQRPGILLVEAKAHDEELIKEEGGKRLTKGGSSTNHAHIGTVIGKANKPFSDATDSAWSLSHEHCYQMSNRFASACKLTELGYPVILVYLGFLHATEMTDLGNPLSSPKDWDRLVTAHSMPLFPQAVWNQAWTLHGQAFVPLIKTLDWPLPPKCES